MSNIGYFKQVGADEFTSLGTATVDLKFDDVHWQPEETTEAAATKEEVSFRFTGTIPSEFYNKVKALFEERSRRLVMVSRGDQKRLMWLVQKDDRTFELYDVAPIPSKES